MRPRPLVAREAQARQRLVHALVERVAAEDVEAVLEVGVVGAGGVPVVLEAAELLGHALEVGRAMPHGGAQVGRGHERLVEVRLLAEQPERQPALARRDPPVRLVLPRRDPQQRRLARAVRPDEADPLAGRDGRRDAVEDDERPDLADHALEAQEAHAVAPAPRRAASRRVAAAAAVLAARSRARLGLAIRPPERALALELDPAAAGPRRRRRGPGAASSCAGAAPRAARSAAGSRWHHEQKWVARMPITIRRIGRPQRWHGWPVRW